jgi:hypothetical protein
MFLPSRIGTGTTAFRFSGFSVRFQSLASIYAVSNEAITISSLTMQLVRIMLNTFTLTSVARQRYFRALVLHMSDTGESTVEDGFQCYDTPLPCHSAFLNSMKFFRNMPKQSARQRRHLRKKLQLKLASCPQLMLLKLE